VECLGTTVGEALLTPTRIYAQPVRKILRHYKVKTVVHGLAHITGGGLRDNLERILPAGVQARIDEGSWRMPPVFSWLQRLGEIDDAEMARVFNMGIGLVIVVNPYFADNIQRMLADHGLDSWQIGQIVPAP
jgi:phosphoribosylformylglycinamidine cyclo-ligase